MYSKNAWIPVRCGDIYCSPACGGGCRRSDYEAAEKAGKQLVQWLSDTNPGMGWRVDLNENMGWHVKAISKCERLKVYPLKHTEGYSAFLGPPDSIGGLWVKTGNTPKEAIQYVVEEAKKELAELQVILKGL